MFNKSLKALSAVVAMIIGVSLIVPSFSKNIFAADEKSYNEQYSGVMKCVENDTLAKLDFEADFDTLLYSSNTEYSGKLCKFAEIMATDVYDKMCVTINNKTSPADFVDNTTLYNIFGMKDIKETRLTSDSYNVDPSDVSHYVCSHRQFEVDGQNKEVIFVVIEGTNGTAEQWYSNLDMGNSNGGYTNLTGEHPEWTNMSEHKGFNVASNRVMSGVENYIDSYVDKNSDKIILITGHSRGAAIANIIGTKFENDPEYKSFTYTFASPSTTLNTETFYETIFNIVNTKDLVTYIPLQEWGFSRYGTTLAVDLGLSKNYSSVVEKNGVPAKYADFTYCSIDDLIDGIYGILPDFDALYTIDKNNEMYKYSYSVSPQTMDENKFNEERGKKIDILNKFNINNFCEVTDAFINEKGDREFDIYYAPSAILNLISVFVSSDDMWQTLSDVSVIVPDVFDAIFTKIAMPALGSLDAIRAGHEQQSYYVAVLDLEVPVTPSYPIIPVTPNEIRDITNEEPAGILNNFGVGLDNSVDELEKLFNITPEEKVQGVNVWIEMTTTAGEVNSKEAAQIESALKNNTLAQYFEINLYKKVGNNDPTPVTNTSGDLKIKFTVPEQFRANSRNFLMMYSHNGNAAKTITPISYNSENGQLLFSSSEFSTYALVYNDFVKTSDQNNMFALIIALAVASGGLTVTIAYRRKTETTNH